MQVSVVVATAVNGEGRPEVLGIDVGTSEDGAFWLGFLRGLVARGLSGVELVTSDAHAGLTDAIANVFAGASWQRCRRHFMANLSSLACAGSASGSHWNGAFMPLPPKAGENISSTIARWQERADARSVQLGARASSPV